MVKDNSGKFDFFRKIGWFRRNSIHGLSLRTTKFGKLRGIRAEISFSERRNKLLQSCEKLRSCGEKYGSFNMFREIQVAVGK